MGYLVKISNLKNEIIKPKSFDREEVLQELADRLLEKFGEMAKYIK